jgi:hypothetical protein
MRLDLGDAFARDHRELEHLIDGVAVLALLVADELAAFNQTNRERITELTGVCGAMCHNAYINPVGFAFESFDGMGQLRALDNGKPVDTSGSYPFTEGTLSFDDAAELMQLMANGRQAHACYAKKIASYSLQRDIVESDLPLIDSLAGVSMDTAGSIKRMLIGLAQSPAFYVRAGGAP